MEFSRPEYWSWVANLRIKPRSSTLQANSLPAEPPGKPKNTVVGSLSLLQWILSNPGTELGSPALQVDSLPTELSGKPYVKTNNPIKK